MKLYCANCGKLLKHTRKALPKIGTIVDLIEYHECSKEPIPYDIDPSLTVSAPPVEGMDKFIKSLNNLDVAKKATETVTKKSLRPPSMIGTDNLRDRRYEQEPRSSAPSTIVDQIRQFENSIPEHELEESKKSEMGD